MNWIRIMAPNSAAAFALLAIALGCAHNGNDDPRSRAYRNGEQAAAREIADGNPRLYGIALAGGPPVDGRTGLPMVWFSNCLNDRAMEAFVRGHNDYVLRHLRGAATAPSTATQAVSHEAGIPLPPDERIDQQLAKPWLRQLLRPGD